MTREQPAQGPEQESCESRVESPERASSHSALAALVSRLFFSLPTILVLAALGGIGYWGHHAGWKIPKFSQLTASETAAEEFWCAAHGVPESICVACRARLMPKGELHGWCSEHGVAECVLQHPQIAQLDETPVVSQADLDRARRALTIKPRAENDPDCKLHLRRIQFESTQAADKAGIETEQVTRGPIVEAISANGQITYDPTRVVRLASRADGTVWRVEKNVGDPCQAGDVLALVNAADVGRAKSDLLRAVAQLDLQEKTFQRLEGLEGVVAGRRLQQAEVEREKADIAVNQAIQTLVNLGLSISREEIHDFTEEELAKRLQFLGLPQSVADQLDPRRITANLIPLVAPRDGTVVMRDVVAGEVIDTSITLFTVVDTSGVWLLFDVPVEDVNYIAIGQKVLFRPDGESRDHRGAVTWISTEVDVDTRTVKVRAELPNDEGRLRNESYGLGRIVLRDEKEAIIVPSSAVHWEGCCHVAFVRDKNYLQEGSYKVFHTRMVRPGVINGDTIEVIAGLLPGEFIVTDGSGVLRAELLKGNLGAG